MRQRPHPAFLVTLLVWGMVAGTALYPALAVLASSIIADLDLSTTGYGLLLFVFSASAAALSPRGGRLTDRLGGRRSLALTFALAAVGVLGISGSTSLWALSGSAVILAVGQSTMNPSTNKLIANLTEPGARGLTTGVKQSGVYVGYVITGLVAPPVAAQWGWRAYFLVLAGFLALGALVTLWGLPADAPDRSSHDEVRAPIPPWVNTLAFYGFAMGLGSSSVAFIPLFAETQLGFTNAAAGVLASTLGAVAIATRILGARAVERSHRYRSALTLSALTGVLFGVTALWSVSLPGLIWVAVTAFALGLTAWNAIGMLAVIDLTGKDRAGAATGRVLMGFLSGLAIGPVAHGRLVETLGYGSAWVATGVFAAVAALSVRRWHPPPRA